MATRLGIRELRDNLTTTLRRVRAGETVEVTHHGVAIAVISPVADDPVSRLIAAGAARPGVPLDAPLRAHRVTGDVTASEALADDRAADR